MSAPASAQPTELTPEVARFIETWAARISNILTQTAGTAFTLQLVPAPAEKPASDSRDLKLLVVSAGALRGEMTFNLTATAVVGLGQLARGEPQNAAAEFKAEWRDTVLALFREAGAATASALADQLGNVQMQTEACETVSWSAAATGWLESVSEAPYKFTLEWQVSPALAASLRVAINDSTAVTSGIGSDLQAGRTRLEVLLDVELDVVLRFGQRSMTLREILELDGGSVINLDRKVNDPVELLVDGRVIARGEVVVVDGNYGLRIQELADVSKSS